MQSGLIFQYEVFLPQCYYLFPDICHGLVHAPNLRIITIPATAAYESHLGIDILAKNRSLQKIWLAYLGDNYSSSEIVELEEICARFNPRGLVALKSPPVLVIYQYYDPSPFTQLVLQSRKTSCCSAF